MQPAGWGCENPGELPEPAEGQAGFLQAVDCQPEPAVGGAWFLSPRLRGAARPPAPPRRFSDLRKPLVSLKISISKRHGRPTGSQRYIIMGSALSGFDNLACAGRALLSV